MFGWLKEYLEIRYEFRKRKQELALDEANSYAPEPDPNYCESCQTLKEQLSIANQEKRQLLDRLLFIPEKEEAESADRNFKPIMPKSSKSWGIIRKELEENDRNKAKVLEEARRSTDKISTSDLEKQLEIAAQPKTGTEGERN